MKSLRIFLFLAAFGVASSAFAQLGNAWHLPNTTLSNGDKMRTPTVISSASTVTIYSGSQFQGAGNAGNQTGGSVFYKAATDGAWQSVALVFHAESGNDKFWKASFSVGSLANAGTAGVIQYYLRINYSDHATTYLHGTDSASNPTGTEATAAASPFSFQLTPELSVNGVGANYTTTKLFVDEVAAESIPLTVVFRPNAGNVDPATVEVYTNLNRRDRATLDANADSFEDGVHPPHADTVTTTSTTYYGAYAMTGSGGQYSATLHATKTGAYRLSARYRTVGSPVWIYFSTDESPGRGTFAGRRDHAITVSPKKTRDMVMYELNPLVVEATGTTEATRSTFDDLLGAADGDGDGFDPFKLSYLQSLGVNWLWFQPIHPPGIDGRQIDPDTGLAFEVGSPYAVKNFFKINPLLGSANTEADARAEFLNFIAKADLAGVHVMLDAPFNHTSYDCEVADQGVAYFGGSAGAEIRNTEARLFSRDADGSGAGGPDYAQRASSAGTIAIAPDRGEFKFADTYDVYYGRYSALVNQNPADNANILNEDDRFLYADANWTGDTITKKVWRYFGDYIVYWLNETGCTAGLTPAQQVDKGIDGLRADFGQGLPPQAWEYIINKARSRKWTFVFMAESIDGGPVTYRSNRHFDILNENIVFALQAATTSTDYRSIYESRRAAYGQALVLLNSTSHDEANYTDPFQALLRFCVNGSVDGVPMIFNGQELGISGGGPGGFGFNRYELNVGKYIPHFKKYNSMKPAWDDASFANDQLYPVYQGVAAARHSSTALRSSNRFFLDQTVGGTHAKIFAAAKFETKNAAPALSDVVFAFANIDRDNNQSGTFNIAQDTDSDTVNDYGLKPARTYNIRNIAAYTAQIPDRREVFLWTADDDANSANGIGKTGANLLANGLFVGMNKVPTTDGAWTTAPYEAQYLKLYDVTPPPAAGTPGTPKAYVIGSSATFSWTAAADPEGGISGYRVVISTQPGGAGTVLFDGIVATTSKAVTGSFGQTLYASVKAISNAGIESTAASNGATGTLLLDPAADHDGDGQRNDREDLAGTDPQSAASVFRSHVAKIAGGFRVQFTAMPGVAYSLMARDSLTAGAWVKIRDIPAEAAQREEITDDLTSLPQRYYQVVTPQGP